MTRSAFLGTDLSHQSKFINSHADEPKDCLANADESSGSLRRVKRRITGPPIHFKYTFEERRDLDIQKLRQETEADHHNVEGSVPLMHQGLNLAEYVQCLQRLYGVVAAWEERAAEIGPEWLQPSLLTDRDVLSWN
jgi:hypothetical protein